MAEYTGVLGDLEEVWLQAIRKKLREWGDISPSTLQLPSSPRLSTLSSCDRSRPAHLFAIYDEEGTIVLDDC